MSIDKETQIWHQPMKPAAEIIELVKADMQDVQEEITLTITLTGVGAGKYQFISNILQHGFGESPENIAKYILRAGIEREIERVTESMQGKEPQN